jgi:AraC family transcriptional activator FtrA
MFPQSLIDADLLYVADGSVLTSGGTAAAIDLSLHVVREAYGPKVAAAIARRMVMPPLRCGGQAQYIEAPILEPQTDRLAGVLAWTLSNLDQEETVEELARRAHMSGRPC